MVVGAGDCIKQKQMADDMENDVPVKVAVRQRPLESKDDCDIVVKYEEKCANIILIDEKPFCFDYILRPEVTQKELFAELIDPLVEKVKKGFNCTALAYGQTGTGKSYTMGLSVEVGDPNQAGVVRHCLWKLLKDIDDFEIRASFIEIYNEKAFDLLSPCGLEPIMGKGFKFTGGTRKIVSSMEDCNDILRLGISKRHVRPTVMNSQSSRSHVIFTIELLSRSKTNPTRACLNLVDLAGSEGLRRTNHVGVAMSEGVHINQGLLSIGKIVQAMSEGSKVIPYRDSVLGFVLQDSLNANSYLTLLACISAKRIDLSETLTTIRFAQRAKQLKRTPKINSILMELNKAKTKAPHDVKKTNENGNSLNPTPLKLVGPTVSKENSINGGKLHQTYCTTSNGKRIASQFNHTEIGLTPKEKKKAQSRITSYTAVRSRMPPPTRQSKILNSTAQRESLFDHTIESWNISSSTTLESLPSAPKSTSYSPLINKCLEKFETVLENKMLSCTNQPTSYSPIVQKCMEKFEGFFESKMLKLMQTIQKNQNTTTEEPNTPTIPDCHLFTTSSPVFKVPEVPRKRNEFRESQNPNELCIEPNNLSAFEHSIEQQTVGHVRRSTRILERTLRNESMLHNSSISELFVSPRRSTRRTTFSIVDSENRRRSKRMAAKLKKMTKKSKPREKSLVDNSFLATHLKEASSSSSSNSSASQKIKKHRKAILALLNNGSQKDLQVLPQIGKKTAFQLVTHRILNGKFKSIAQIEKMPIWRGNAWERFAQANMLI